MAKPSQEISTIALYVGKNPKCYAGCVDRSTPHPSKFYLLQIADFIGAAGRYVAYYRSLSTLLILIKARMVAHFWSGNDSELYSVPSRDPVLMPRVHFSRIWQRHSRHLSWCNAVNISLVGAAKFAILYCTLSSRSRAIPLRNLLHCTPERR